MRRISTPAMAATFIVAGLTITTFARAEDGLSLLAKVQSTYLGLKSYSQKLSSTITTTGLSQVSTMGQKSEMRFQAPNRIFISISSPYREIGTLVTYNTPQQMFVYRSAINSYRKLPPAPNCHDYLIAMRKFGIGTLLDPLAFLSGEPVGISIVSAAIKPEVKLDNVRCKVVVAQIKPQLLGKAKSGSATFWVDASTNLLRKIDISIRGMPVTEKYKGLKDGKQVVQERTLSISRIFSMTVQEVQANPPLNDASFAYTPPKDAIEQNPDKAVR